MTVTKGYDPGYFLRSVAVGKENYYTAAVEAGMEPAGHWEGTGLTALGLEAGSVVDPDALRDLFTKRQHPVSHKELVREPHGFKKLEEQIKAKVTELMAEEPEEMRTPEREREITFMVRSDTGREHVNFYDFGFDTPKSAGLLQVGWMAAAAEARAAGDLNRAADCKAKADEIEQAVHASARTIVRLAEKHVYVRTGHHSDTSGEWRDTAGLTAAVFVHHTSRTAKGEAVGDPQLHAHVAFWAYAQRGDGADTKHRSIDAAGLYQMQGYYQAVAELEMEQRLQRMGYALKRTPGGDFEVGGLHDPKLIKAFSSRTSEITEELAPHVQAFIARHGRAPSRTTMHAMRKNATMKTRQPKEHAPDRARQHAVWDAKYRAVTLEALTDIPVTAADYAAAAAAVPEFDAVQRAHCAAVAVATLQQRRATWSWAQLAMEVRRTLPVLPASVRNIDALVLGMTREALAGGDVVLLKPPPAVEMPGRRRGRGESVYTRPSEFAKYATVEHLLAEGRLVDDAARPTAPVLGPEAAARAVGSDLPAIEAERERLATDTGAHTDPVPLSVTGLTNDQALAVFGLLQSRTTGNVLVGAAGTGKSRTVAKLADIIRGTTGHRVIGVTSSENAARVLRSEGLDDAYNIADFLGYQEGTDVRRGHRPLNEGDWLVIDEAGTTDTTAVAELNEVVKRRGAHLLYTGDPFGQLGSVGAGGAMRLVAEELGYYELHKVKRFKEAWEGPASLRIRAGDVTALREYIDRGRVLEGSEEEVTGRLVKQYTGSLVAGRNPLLITDSNGGAEKLAALVRDQLVELGEVDGEGELTGLADGNDASRGDLVRAMKNDKRIDAGGQKLANRDVLRIDRLGEHQAVARRLTGIRDGRHEYGPAFTLPRAYLEQNSALAYGGNIFVTQGLSVDDSYQLFTDATDAASLYVPLTRGRDRNVVGVVTERVTADPLGDRAPPRHVTAEALLSRAITRERDDLTATEYLRKEQDTEYGMPSLVGRWQALTRDGQFTAYDTVMREAMTPEDYAKMADDAARGTLVRHLRAAELGGRDATALLREAIRQRDFTSAGSVAAVLHGRVARLAGPESHKALCSYSAATPDLADPQAAAAARELARLADERATQLGEQAVADRPVWALHALGDPPADPLARQEWAGRASRIAAWRELASYKDPVNPVGPAPKMGAVELRAAWRGAADAVGLSEEDQGIRETPEMQLVAQAREAARVKAWEPADVSQERREAELVKGDMVAESMMADAAARNAEAPDAAKAQELAGSFRQLTQELSVRTAWLGEQDEHRRDWHATNAAKLARGVQARAELERRREAGEFIGEWDIAMAYLTLKSDLEAPKAEPGARAQSEAAAKAAPEPEAAVEAEPEATVATAPVQAEAKPEPKPKPEVGAAPLAEPQAEAAVEPETETEPQVEAAPEVKAEAEPVTAAPESEPETIRPVGSDAEWFLDRAQREAEVKAEPKAEAEVMAEPEVAQAATEGEAPVGQALEEDEAEVMAEDRADHFRAVAEHRERAVEHPGRAGSLRSTIESIRASQARINEERTEAEAGEHPFTYREPEPQTGAEHQAEGGDR